MFGQVGQAKRVGDMAPAFADHAGDVAVRIAIIGAELGVSGGFFERVEVRPLHVFDDGDLERFAVASLDDNDRDLVQPCPLRGPPAALAGDDFIGIRDAEMARTTTGWIIPRSLIEAASSSSSASSNRFRGLRGFGRRNSIGVWRAPRAGSGAAGSPRLARPPVRARGEGDFRWRGLRLRPWVSFLRIDRVDQAARQRPSRRMTSDASLR